MTQETLLTLGQLREKAKELKKAEAKAKKVAKKNIKEYTKTAKKIDKLETKKAKTNQKIDRKQAKIDAAKETLKASETRLKEAKATYEAKAEAKGSYKSKPLQYNPSELTTSKAVEDKRKEVKATLKANKQAKKDALKELKSAEKADKKLRKKSKKTDKLEAYIETKGTKQKAREDKLDKLHKRQENNPQAEAGTAKVAAKRAKKDTPTAQQPQTYPSSTIANSSGNVVSAHDPTISFRNIPDVIQHSLDYMQSRSHKAAAINTTKLEGDAIDLKARFQNSSPTTAEQKALNVDYGAWCTSAWVKEAEYHKNVEKQLMEQEKLPGANKEFLASQREEAAARATEAMKHAEINAKIATDQLGQGTSPKLQEALNEISQMHERTRSQERAQSLDNLDRSSSTDTPRPRAATAQPTKTVTTPDGSPLGASSSTDTPRPRAATAQPIKTVATPDGSPLGASSSTDTPRPRAATNPNPADAIRSSLTRSGSTLRTDSSKASPAAATPSKGTDGNTKSSLRK